MAEAKIKISEYQKEMLAKICKALKEINKPFKVDSDKDCDFFVWRRTIYGLSNFFVCDGIVAYSFISVNSTKQDDFLMLSLDTDEDFNKAYQYF